MAWSDLTQMPGLLSWYKSEALSGYADGDLIDQWEDSGPLAAHLSATGSARPVAASDILPGHTAAVFSGGQSMASGQYELPDGPVACCGVMRLRGGSFRGMLLIHDEPVASHPAARFGAFVYATGDMIAYSGSPYAYVIAAVGCDEFFGDWQTVSAGIGGAGVVDTITRPQGRCRQTTGQAVGVTSDPVGLSHNIIGDTGLGGGKLVGDLVELVVYHQSGVGEESWVEGYLAHKYGLTLAQGHLFRESPPTAAPFAYPAGGTGSSSSGSTAAPTSTVPSGEITAVGPYTLGSDNVESVPVLVCDSAGAPATSLPDDFAIAYRRSDTGYIAINTVAATVGNPIINGLASVPGSPGEYELGIGAAHKASGSWLTVKWSGTGIRTDRAHAKFTAVDLQDSDAAGLDVSQFKSTLTPADIRTELATELARLDAAISSRSSHSPAGVRTELATELGRIDEPVSAAKTLTAATLGTLFADVDAGQQLTDFFAGLSARFDDADDVAVTTIAAATISQLVAHPAIVELLADAEAARAAAVAAGAAVSGLNDLSAAEVLTTALTESYAADGAAPTLSQLLFLIAQHLGESSITGTVKTVRRIDGQTVAATFALDDATRPTSITRQS